MSTTIYAPASIGNVGVGFDLLGAALAPVDDSLLGDCVTVEHDKEGVSFSCTGVWKHKLPENPEQNIVLQCARHFIAAMPEKLRPAGLKINLEKNLPVGSGLGSSASSVVAAFAALNEHCEKPFDPNRLLRMMGEFEGKVSGSVHYDNVAPSYLGGLQLMLLSPDSVCEPVPFFENWFWVIAYPGISLPTAQMRALLPTHYDRAIAIDFGRNLAAFIHASYRNDAALALSFLKDVMAEPYRRASIPRFEAACTALKGMGMLASGISGSGPTIFSVTDNLKTAGFACEWLSQHFLHNENGFTRICRIDKSGARLVKETATSSLTPKDHY